MATYSKLPSGRWRVQVRRGDIYRAHTFDLKRQAKTWATEIKAQALQVRAGVYITPKGLTIGKLVKMYGDNIKEDGRTRNALITH